MPVLTVNLPGEIRRIPFAAGRSLRDILDETDIRVRAGCNGGGACGLCRVRIAGGDAGEPSPAEVLTLESDQLLQGVRLACQVTPRTDQRIEIINPAPHSVWRSLGDSQPHQPGGSDSPTVDGDEVHLHPLGAAIDLGTTHISLTVHDLKTGRRLAGRCGPNPQAVAGSDVLTRLQAASTAAEAEKLRGLALRAIGEGFHDIGSREGLDLRRVSRVVLAGNSAMLALMSGRNAELLLDPRYWSRPIDCCPTETASWLEAWQIDARGDIEVLSPVAGFVGSDLLAGVVATRLTDQEPGALLIDFGTNSEVALWDGANLWITSAAGGPAFEGCGMSCGMPADPGAIFRVRDLNADGGLTYEVIGDAEPLGLCGTGMVDLLACLKRGGILNGKGQFSQAVSPAGFVLPRTSRTLVLTKRDVDTFQRAKAAIGVAVDVLLAKAGLNYSQVQRVCIGGIFGQYLDGVNAREIGLLPSCPALVETVGNSSLSGCEAILLSPEGERLLQKARDRAVSVNLSAHAGFDELFLEHLFLTPITGERGHD